MYSVSRKTISDINNGHSRKINKEQYPIRRKNLYKSISKDISREALLSAFAGHLTTSEICECFDISFPTLMKIRHKYGLDNYHNPIGIIVLQCDKDTKHPIKEFPSVREAARTIGCNANSIFKALKSKSHISYGYYWIKK